MAEKTAVTDTQKKVLDFVGGFIQDHGFPPSLGEIGAGCGIGNTSSVDYHLRILQERGYLRRSGDRHRGLELLVHPFRLPILGRVGAGGGLLAQEDVEGYVTLDKNFSRKASFMLRVKGDSMIGAGIFEGDLVQVRRQAQAEDGEIVVAVVHDEGVVKRLRRRGRGFVLESANPKYRPIAAEFQVVGKVVGLIRRYGK